MKINEKMLHIPPYISTAWKNVASLQVESRPFGLLLMIELISGSRVHIPNLELPFIEKIFAAHAEHMEIDESPKKGSLTQLLTSFPFAMPAIPIAEGVASILQHNPEQADSPPLPLELIEKIGTLAKTMGLQDFSVLPKGEPHCNCPYCQVSRAFQNPAEAENASNEEEMVTDEDLRFKTWDIKQTGDKLYIVSNPLNAQEEYSVFLGSPVGCTCGEKECEHIQVVLRS